MCRILSKAAFLLCILISRVGLASPWHDVKAPSLGEANAIGSYANGCLSGAQALPLDGVGYQVIRASRERYFGHAELIDFIQDLGRKTSQLGGSDLLIGDMSMPRGGHFISGHQSHQTGLDVDIWLLTAKQKMDLKERESLNALNVVDLKNYRINFKRWSEEHTTLISTAAKDERVSRIFVHPVIKEALCKETWSERDWLRKVRPWYGHTSHMHVRLTCPQGNVDCVNQLPPPEGDGCGAELYSWRPKAQAVKIVKSATKKNEPPKRIAKVKPQQCEALLDEKG
ncbi:penicillin-insensitive murein endopeptidase [Thaumasiovibrio sp. DFM-14]|uniref:penicillin-insensitive murein endopeptidase n=1 Tax=Thaumasiovibrio sp. DFM-14 TaxID=3384792 RepID=UPI00399FE568